MNKFNKYIGKISFIVDGEELSLNRIKTERIQKLMNATQDSDTFLTSLVNFFVELISENYPDDDKEGIQAFVQSNSVEIFEEFQVAYGLVSRKDLDKAKKEAE